MAGGFGAARPANGQYSGQGNHGGFSNNPNGNHHNGNNQSGNNQNGNHMQRSYPKPPSGGYDGSGEPSRPNPFAQGMGYDPAKPVVKESKITNTRAELPATAYDLDYDFPVTLPNRPAINTSGKEIQVRVNQFKVTGWPQKNIYQYDILVGNEVEKKGKVMAVWKSKAVQDKLGQYNGDGHHFLWDGNRLAWSDIDIPELRINVNLDQERGRTPREGKPADVSRVIIRKAKVVRMDVIQGYLSRQMAFDNSVLEAINFLDHAMRQTPSQEFTMIKRSFYPRGGATVALDNVIHGLKGVYSSMRLCAQPSIGGASSGLAVNVDVSNGTFWTVQDVHQAARNLCSKRNRNLDYQVFINLLAPVRKNNGSWEKSDEFKDLAKMQKVKFRVKHRGKNDDGISYTIKRFCFKEMQGGGNAKNVTFKYKNKNFNPPRDEDISVFDYFKRTYNITLQYWQLPVIETERAGLFPMELCIIWPNQRYSFKLSPEQTAAMIKFAVTRPKERLASVAQGTKMLKWATDPYLMNYGIKVDPNLTVTKARLLQNPEIQFTGSKINPGTQGRWDLRGKKFWNPNPEPLKSWGVCVVASCVAEATVRTFINTFVQIYIGHGGRVENKNPVIYSQPKSEDLALTIHNTRLAAGNQAKSAPQILFYVLPARDSFLYERLKKNNECRFGLVSQCMNVAHVQKNQPQYCSNVAMKVNAKLGGATCKALKPGPKPAFFARPTMVIGADVSHAAPGSPQASMAAITMSFDSDAVRFAAMCQTNGKRVEMISENTIRSMFLPMFRQWMTHVGKGAGPQHIYYFRDGVSEGQYTHVLRDEVAAFKKVLEQEFGANATKIQWTVTICSKRHHIRFFPKDNDNSAGDRNGNPLPGVLVDRDVTHPFEYDFYLNAHSAIQGTARPTHYHVILDEAKVAPNEFQNMIYQMSYQYMRSTTPVSIIPAVYYAHLASNRARAHESVPTSDGPRGGQKFEERRAREAQMGGAATSISDNTRSYSEVGPLLPLGNPDAPEVMQKIRNTMWYI